MDNLKEIEEGLQLIERLKISSRTTEELRTMKRFTDNERLILCLNDEISERKRKEEIAERMDLEKMRHLERIPKHRLPPRSTMLQNIGTYFENLYG